jgi:hypothetical protein
MFNVLQLYAMVKGEARQGKEEVLVDFGEWVAMSWIATWASQLTVRGEYVGLKLMKTLFGCNFSMWNSVPSIACIYGYSKLSKLLPFSHRDNFRLGKGRWWDKKKKFETCCSGRGSYKRKWIVNKFGCDFRQ